jgi:transposase
MGNRAGVRRDFDALEKPRFDAIALEKEGLNQTEVARRLRVLRQTVARWPCLESSDTTGLDPATPHRTSARTKRRTDPQLEAEGVTRHLKKTRTEGHTIVFVDESGISQRPHRCPMWAVNNCSNFWVLR